MAIKFYIAGKFSARERLSEHRDYLRSKGFEVSSTWMDYDDVVRGDNTSLAIDSAVNIAAADRDIREVREANIFIIDTFDDSLTGGREVELGMAIAWNKTIFMVGSIRNVFHAKLPRFEKWYDLLEAIQWLE